MIDNVDLKVVAGIAFTLVLGGGIYGVYFKTMGKAALSETQAQSLNLRCQSLLVTAKELRAMSPADKQKTMELAQEVEKLAPDLLRADAVLTGVGIAVGERKGPMGMTDMLQSCMRELTNRAKNPAG